MRSHRLAPTFLRRLAIALGAAAALVALLSVAGLVVANRFVVPRLVERASQAIADRADAELEVASARLTLPGGVRFTGARVTLPDRAADLAVGDGHVDLGWARAVRLARALRSGVAPSATEPWGLLRHAAALGVAPRRIELRDVRVTLGYPESVAGLPFGIVPPGGGSFRTQWSAIAARYDERADRWEVAADGAVLTADGDLTPRMHAAALPADDAPRLSIRARLDDATSTVWAELVVERMPLPFEDADAGELAARVAVEATPDGRYEAEGSVAATGVVATVETVAGEPIGPIDASYAFELTVDPLYPFESSAQLRPAYPIEGANAGRIVVERGELVVNGIVVEVRPSLRGVFAAPGSVRNAGTLEGRRYADLELRLAPTEVDAIRRAVPVGLLGPLRTVRLDGEFAWNLDLHVPLHAIGEMQWEATTTLHDFAVRQIGWDVNPFKLKGPFLHTIEDPAVEYERTVLIPAERLPSPAWTVEHSEHGARRVTEWREQAAATSDRLAENRPRVVEPVSGDGGRTGAAAGASIPDDRSYRYVRLEEMSPWVVRAVLTAEDGDFFFHEGVNFYTLPRALERNVRAGEIRFGASTISMQLVKMLFLDQDRRVARKLQEVFLVYLMEHQVGVTKERILEVYLNIAEFGPGIFGIADAAAHYFAADPAELSAGEATWLASILPSPKRYHQYYELGEISAGWFERMKSYYDIMLERERMTADEYEEAIEAPPEFG
ncbi:MAG: biosynthetic peptidoglycan transglycosylase [Spirochaetota bacterium]